MRNRIFAVLLAVVMVLAVLPTAVFAAEAAPTVYIAGVAYTGASGETLPSGVAIDFQNHKITLNGANINWDLTSNVSSSATGIFNGTTAKFMMIADSSNTWTISLSGTNNISINLLDSSLKVLEAQMISANTSLVICGEGENSSLTITENIFGLSRPIYVTGDLTIQNTDIAINPNWNTYSEYKASDLGGWDSVVYAQGALTVNNASIDIDTDLPFTYGVYTLTGNTNVSNASITIDGENILFGLTTIDLSISDDNTTIEINCKTNGISSKNTTISGGTVDIDVSNESNGAAINTQKNVSITSGNVTVNSEKKGIVSYSGDVNISGGVIAVTAPVAIFF